VLVFTVDLSDEQLHDLQIWRNVLVAGIPREVGWPCFLLRSLVALGRITSTSCGQVAGGLPDVQLLRYQAVLEAPKHPLLGALRTVLYVAPHVRVCSGALELAFNIIRDEPEGGFGLAAEGGRAEGGRAEGGRCRWEVEGYRVGGAAWDALNHAMQTQAMPPAPRSCSHVPAFVLDGLIDTQVHLSRAGAAIPAPGGRPGASNPPAAAHCGVLDTVYSPLIRRSGVVLVMGKGPEDALAADLLGVGRAGDDAAQAGNCRCVWNV